MSAQSPSAKSVLPRAMHDAEGVPIGALFAALASSADGLSSAEAAQRLSRDGPNDPRPAGRRHPLAELLGLFANPLTVILLLAAVVSGILGDAVGAALIVAIVLLSVTLNAVLGYRSRQAAERLRAEIAPTATVRRDGSWAERPRRELVTGDVIRLCAGDRVPADACLIDARDLHVQQAALTGESMPVEKAPCPSPDGASHGAQARHLVFLGTSVVAGTATALVVATGRATAFGDVAELLSERPPRTEFERGLDGFAQLILRTVVFLLLFVLLASFAAGRPPLQSLLFALALAVGLTPEFMPMIVTVTLARGAVRMARRRVIVKHLSAIEDFGSMTVLLSDKTGTLTRGETVVESALDPLGAAADRPLSLAALNSGFQTGIRSPIDAAILRRMPCDGAAWRKVDEIPFDFERRRLGVVVAQAEACLLVVKGAPESVLAACTHVEVAGTARVLDTATRAAALRVVESLGERGSRVVAVASRAVSPQPHYAAADERELVLAGFVSLADPVAPDAAQTLADLARDGVAVKIVSGDDERVARHVCASVGLDADAVVSGDAVDALGDTALGLLAERTSVFARLSPAQKHRVVLALKARGHVVGFLGDGINDAPSLHAADVGISVAQAADVARDAADIVLREPGLAALHAGIVEGRRAFANVMKYLLMGTSSNFGNMLSMAAAAAFLPFLPMLPTQILLNGFLYDLAQTTIPTDNVDAEQLRRPQRWNVRRIRDFMLVVGPLSSLYDIATFYVLLRWMHASEPLFHTGWFVESLATQTLVLFVIRTSGNPFACRPSPALALAAAAVLAAGMALPWSPLAGALGFVPLPPAFLAFLAVATATYLMLVEAIKRRLSLRSAGA